MKLEENLEKMEAFADAIEDKNITLQQALAIFEESVKLADESLKELDDCKGKLVVLQEKMKKLTDDN